MTAIGTLDTVSLDANDPDRLARFSSTVLDLPVTEVGSDYAVLAPFADGGPSLLFLQVPQERSGKNRMHFDVRVDDVPPD